LYRVEQWRPCPATSRGEIKALGWFAVDALPEETTASTRRRIAEALLAEDVDPHW
jgi:hypothetical protein